MRACPGMLVRRFFTHGETGPELRSVFLDFCHPGMTSGTDARQHPTQGAAQCSVCWTTIQDDLQAKHRTHRAVLGVRLRVHGAVRGETFDHATFNPLGTNRKDPSIPWLAATRPSFTAATCGTGIGRRCLQWQWLCSVAVLPVNRGCHSSLKPTSARFLCNALFWAVRLSAMIRSLSTLRALGDIGSGLGLGGNDSSQINQQRNDAWNTRRMRHLSSGSPLQHNGTGRLTDQSRLEDTTSPGRTTIQDRHVAVIVYDVRRPSAECMPLSIQHVHNGLSLPFRP
ncbi:hypothetical protein OH76DRAFT_1421378 [Lentinus brumalis]|uniref:Uncharacterized protein n=1 Tax=Lentinus brumalis TaxID=2498619 RepID=A0A371CW57_9APHY|nr:hypothetical protein OH76DRAFT_1421378 [Polyporus brumalis]